ncbi:hypothetical protein ACFL59_12990 [Planctomycetota bacterium]
MSGIGSVGTGPVDLPQPPDTAPPAAPAPAPPEALAPARGDGGALDSVRSLWSRLTSVFSGEPVPPGTNLDRSEARRPVALGTNGRFSAQPGEEATTSAQTGRGLFAAASLIDDTKGNLIDDMGMPPADRSRLLATLTEDLATVQPGATPPAGLTELQALQMRSSGTTVLLELMTAEETPEETKRAAFDLYRGMIDAETNPLLKDGMALHLVRLRDALPADLESRVDEVRDVVAPTRPPYDEWFKDGNDTVKVDWAAQDHAWDLNIKQLEKDGFKLEERTHDGALLTKEATENGVTTKFEVRMRHNRTDMYRETAEGPSHMQVYTGHSNWGRNMRESLDATDGGADGGANKVVLTSMCVGKGELQMFRDKFPNAHMTTTHNSAYFREGDDAEGVQAFLRMADGIAERRGYASMAEDVRKTNPFRYNHRKIDNNYIFPTDLSTRRKVLDRDHDGQSDIFDRLVSFDTFAVAADTRREFQPVEQPRPGNELVGTKVHFGAQTVNRLALYSQIFKPLNQTAKVLPGGYYDPEPGDTSLFKLEDTEIDGKDATVMTMSSRYAHMSEEALRMAACYEYNMHVASTDSRWRLDDTETKLSGLVLASHSLHTDAGHRDRAVWREFLEAYNLPDISRREVEDAKEVGHSYSGSYESIDVLKEALGAEVLEALERPEVGRIG